MPEDDISEVILNAGLTPPAIHQKSAYRPAERGYTSFIALPWRCKIGFLLRNFPLDFQTD